MTVAQDTGFPLFRIWGATFVQPKPGLVRVQERSPSTPILAAQLCANGFTESGAKHSPKTENSNVRRPGTVLPVSYERFVAEVETGKIPSQDTATWK